MKTIKIPDYIVVDNNYITDLSFFEILSISVGGKFDNINLSNRTHVTIMDVIIVFQHFVNMLWFSSVLYIQNSTADI